MNPTQPQGNYLENLENGLARLRQMVNDSNKSENFNQKVIEKIKTIDVRLAVLREQAINIVNLVKQLKSNISENSAELSSNKKIIQTLDEKILAVNQEKESLNAEIARLTSGQSDAATELNAQIQRQEATIKELTQKMSEKENEFLNQQKMQGEDFNAKDAQKLQQIQELGQQIEQLEKSVTEKEAQLSQLNQEMADAIREKQNVIDILRESSGGVNAELSKLREENKMLIDKIITSTNVIANALKALEEIRSNPDLADIDAKIAQTNAIIEEITGILTGSGAPVSSVEGESPANDGDFREVGTGGYKRGKKRGGFFANYDVDKNRKSRKSSTRNSSSYSNKSKKSKKTRKQKKRRSSRSSFRF